MCLSSLLTKQKLVLVVTISVVCGACFCIINYSVPAPWPPRPDDSWSLSLRSPGAVPELHGGPEPGAGPRMMVVGGARVSCFRRSETWLGWCVVLWWMLTAADIFSSHLRSLAASLKLTGFCMSSLYFLSQAKQDETELLQWPILTLRWTYELCSYPRVNYSGLKVNFSYHKVTYSYPKVT